MSQKLLTAGSTFEITELGSPHAWVVCGGVTGVSGLRSGTAAEIDVTDLQSSAKEFLLGFPDEGTATVDLIYDPADPGQVILETLKNSLDVNEFRVGIRNPLAGSPDRTYFTFSARVTTFPFTLGVDAAITGSVGLRITGSVAKTNA
jgi:Lambda phage tail tube protein, TTP